MGYNAITTYGKECSIQLEFIKFNQYFECFLA